LRQIHFWDLSALKDTIFWYLGSALVTFINLNDALQNKDFFKNIVFDNLKFVIIIEFINNLYTFSFPIEMVLLPIICLIVMLDAFAEIKPEYEKVKRFLDALLGVFGICLIVYTFRNITIDFQNFASLKNLRDFLLPIFLSIMLLPCIYFIVLYIQYEHIFMLIDFANKGKKISKSLKKKIFISCNINLSRLVQISRNVGFSKLERIEDIDSWFEQTSYIK